jgi:riboflavin kinase/FMN adenylyltransferase
VEVLEGLASCPQLSIGSAATIGAYDGVHLGHRALIQRVRHLAAELGSASAVVTFDQHPARVVRPDSAPRLLTDLEQKLDLLATTGVDYTLVVPFDKARSEESAEDFVVEVLVRCLRVRAVLVGHDFHFGHGRRGNVALLQDMGGRHGFEVHGINLIADSDGAVPVSSTRIRELLAEGDVEGAAVLLDRDHEVRGTAGAGHRVEVPGEIQLPAPGLYTGTAVQPGGGAQPAVITVGPYGDPFSVLDLRLRDGSEWRAGQPARLRFRARLPHEAAGAGA